MTEKQRMQNSPIYKILELARDEEFEKNDNVLIEDLRELIEREAPEIFEQFQDDNPREPKEPDYGGDLPGEYSERMARIQRLK